MINPRLLSCTSVRQVVVLTGASSGIGKALAHCLFDNGCKLILASRNTQALENLKNDLMTSFTKVSDIQFLFSAFFLLQSTEQAFYLLLASQVNQVKQKVFCIAQVLGINFLPTYFRMYFVTVSQFKGRGQVGLKKDCIFTTEIFHHLRQQSRYVVRWLLTDVCVRFQRHDPLCKKMLFVSCNFFIHRKATKNLSRKCAIFMLPVKLRSHLEFGLMYQYVAMCFLSGIHFYL